MRKRLFQNIAVAAAGIAISLVSAEAALRLLHMPRFFRAHTYPPQFSFRVTDQGTVYYVNLPSSRIRFVYDGNPRGYFGSADEVDHTTNSWGFRGPEFTFDKPADTCRMVFLGDSFTFGEGVRDEDTYPEVARRLMEKNSKTKNTRFQSYNFGVGGYNTAQSVFLFEQVAMRVHPDIVVLGLTLNDAEPELFYVDRSANTLVRRPREALVSEGISDAGPPENPFYRMHLAQLAWQLVYKNRVSGQSRDYYDSLYSPAHHGWAVEKESLRRLISLCEERRLPCYIVCFPVLYRLTDAYPFKHIHELLRAAVEAPGYPGAHFIDLFDRVRGKKDSSLWVHPVDQHPNEAVQRLAAAALVEALLDNKNILEK